MIFPSDLMLTLKEKVSSKDLCWLMVVSLYLRWPDNRSTWLKVEPDLSFKATGAALDRRSLPLDESKSTPLLGGEMRVKMMWESGDVWGYVWYIRYVSVITVSFTLIRLMAFCLWACWMIKFAWLRLVWKKNDLTFPRSPVHPLRV